MHPINCGYTFSGPASDCMPFPSSADAIVNVRHTAKLDMCPAVASKVNEWPLEFVLFGPLAQFARQESSIAQWKLVQPLHVRVVTDSDGSNLASDDFFLNYGIGDTVAAALADYAVTLVEFYHLISASVKVNPMDKPLFDRLRTYLRAKP